MKVFAMKIVYFMVITFVASSCGSTKKTDSAKLPDSTTKIVAIKATNADSIIKTVQSEMGKINTLINKKPN